MNALLRAVLADVREEVTRINKAAGETVFNPALTAHLDGALVGALEYEDPATKEIANLRYLLMDLCCTVSGVMPLLQDSLGRDSDYLKHLKSRIDRARVYVEDFDQRARSPGLAETARAFPAVPGDLDPKPYKVNA